MPVPARTVPGATPGADRIAMARLGVVHGNNDTASEWVDVHFNPASLQLQVTNVLEGAGNSERTQYIARTNAKLTMELQFDTTDNSEDVTQTTRKIQAFIAPILPARERGRRPPPPPLVLFEWGRLKFRGIAENYRETIDFFSANGVPLRASVNLTLSRQDQVFDSTAAEAGERPPEDATDVGTPGPSAARGADQFTPRFRRSPSAADVANAGESPDAARAVAEANGQENLRFGNGSPLTVSAAINLRPPVAFAAGAGIGIGAGAGIGLGAGIGIGAGAGIGLGGGASLGGGVSLGASAGIGLDAGSGIGAAASLAGGISFGAGAGISLEAGIGVAAGGSVGAGAGAGISLGASAGISGLARLSATEGAFGGLRATARAGASTARLKTSRLLPQARSATLSTDRNASFQVGGKATLAGAAGLRADVGARSGSRGRLTFEDS